VAGVDGVRGGWVVATVEPGRVEWAVVTTAAEVLAATAHCAAVGVDIPLGLPPGPDRRACDLAAAQLLERARSSVFPVPPRDVLAAPTHAEACAVARRLTGRAISIQTFGILEKVLDWARLGERPGHVVEVHPELSFRRLAPDVEFASKKSARGAGQRISALTDWLGEGMRLPDLPVRAGLDDALDALAAAWSARRWSRGEAESLGLEIDDRGHPMCIVV
jgi:predicted RNase H-like nuclease